MTYLDITILAILLGFLIKGIAVGLLKQVFSIMGLVVGLALAWKFCPVVSDFGIRVGIHRTISMIIAFLLIYIIVASIARSLGNFAHKTVEALFLGWINRFVGGIFGLIEGVLFIVIILVLISFTPLNKQIQKMEGRAPVLQQMRKLAKPFSEKLLEVKLPPSKFV
jgi:membrane protein required for colicin V production